ncbi:MAG: phosphate acyltransferase PlsX [Candidatus Bipolaricaulota bacterium]
MAYTIAIDVMGADRPPRDIISGSLQAAGRLPIQLVFVGRRRSVEPHLPPDAEAELVDCEQVVEQSEPPVQAVRRKESSLVRGVNLVAEGKADAFLSPGNTGAVVGAALLKLGRLPGVHRPGLCAALPTLSGREVLVIDAGATVDPQPAHLVQFAQMGRIYAQEVVGIAEPKLGLLNIGAEPIKGDKLCREAYKLLSEVPRFAGNVEPHELLSARPVDVAVSGGFAGNLTIKALEGGAEMVLEGFRGAASKSRRGKLGGLFMKSSLRELAAQLRYDRHNGAPLLGVRKLVVAAHGRSSPEAMEAAVVRTFLALQVGLVGRLGDTLGASGAE